MHMPVSMLFSDAASDPSPWLEVFGRAHPVLLHSPLGLLPALLLLEFGALLLRKEPPRGAILAVAWLCALSAAAAAASGLVLAGEDGYSGDTVGQHKLLGLTLGGLCVLAAILALLADRRAFRVVLVLACGVMIPAGHLGGNLTHGADFLFKPLAAKTAAPEKPAQPEHPAEPSTAPADTVPTYAAQIVPILERTCTKCHNEDKQKGELLLTTVDGIRAGGDNGPVFVAGKPDESPLVQRCELPLDDDDHMPPEGKPQPTAEELATLRAWIAAGAKFE
ncbi:MAG: hypothetical protein H6838_06665 [Planctomycetes bacterium]|nr:hypothetical protein [Planctomycetota bacterium]MCB9885157.1 hypothetical protein [Planctomycetota bacterium]